MTRTREFSIELPRLEELPVGVEPLIDRLGEMLARSTPSDVERDSRKRPYAQHARPFHDLPMLVAGRTFFDLREPIAMEIFLHPEYREWTLSRLRRESEDDLRRLRERYRRRAPDASAEAIELAVEASEEGREILRRADNPSPLDLARLLTGWLGDVPAHRLLERWESRAVSDLLAGRGESIEGFDERWRALRDVIFVPSYARELTVLMLARDPDEDRLGFYRIVLPRPSWFQPRVRNYEKHPGWSDVPFDLIPDRPCALAAMRSLLAGGDELTRELEHARYTVSDVRYASRLAPRHQRPRKALSRLTTTVLLESGRPAPAAGAGRRRR